MENKISMTKRQLKVEETKQKLMDAMVYIMEKYDYDTVTIRNICKVSGVSYGSFYNLFQTKEDFLRYYLTSDFVEYMKSYYKDNASFDEKNQLDKVVDLFICCGNYNEEKGLKFISGFYSPYNITLSPIQIESGEEFSFTPLVVKSKEYINQAKNEGSVRKDINIDEAVATICFIFNGISFNWCISKGKFRMSDAVEKALRVYMNTII